MLIDVLVYNVAKKRQISQAEVGRLLGADRGRLYQWKTYRRKMPTQTLYKLITMSGGNIANALGQYAMEWQSVKVQEGKGKAYPEITRAARIGSGG